MTSRDYRDVNVREHALKAFQETIAIKLQHLRRYVPIGTNPALTGSYIEALVRQFVRSWIGNLCLCHGTFYTHDDEANGNTPMQIDGIVWNPQAGPAIIREDDFIIVHPVFCTSVIEINTSIGSIRDFEDRLQEIYTRYMRWATKPQCMGIVIADQNPEAKSSIRSGETSNWAFNYNSANWCPIFILFKEEDGEFTPFNPAIEAMVRSIFTNQRSAGNYM